MGREHRVFRDRLALVVEHDIHGAVSGNLELGLVEINDEIEGVETADELELIEERAERIINRARG